MAEEKSETVSEHQEKVEQSQADHESGMTEKKEAKKDIAEKVAKKVKEGKEIEKANAKLVDENEIKKDASGLTGGEKTLSAVGYILFFCILPLVLKPKSDFCQFNGKQGMILCIIFICLFWVKWFHWALDVLVTLGYIILVILCIINCIEGKIFRVPGIAKLVDKLNFD